MKILIEGKTLKELFISSIIGAGLWIVFGVINSLSFNFICGTSGYYYGILPGAIIGVLIGIITCLYGTDAGTLAGAIIGVLGNFFNAATLSKPLPIDTNFLSFNIRTPIYVAIPGGIFGAISSLIIAKLQDKIFKKES